MSEMEEFDACTIYKREGKQVTISCRLGLWSVTGWYDLQIMDEALHYFRQYRDSGEYALIIGGPNVADILAEIKAAPDTDS